MWTTVIVIAYGLVFVAGLGWMLAACVGGARHERRWQRALNELRAPEARIRVFGEWNNVGECDGE